MRVVVAGIIVACAMPARAEPRRWHVDTRAGVALDRTGAATAVGIGVDLGRFTAGAVLEWNPWFSIDAGSAAPGAFNAYATIARTWYRSAALELYSRMELGTSTLLFELVGVDRYNTGVYVGGSLLGVRVPLRRCVDLTIDPSHYSMPTPQLVGLPFYYRQYRITVGMEFRLP